MEKFFFAPLASFQGRWRRVLRGLLRFDEISIGMFYKRTQPCLVLNYENGETNFDSFVPSRFSMINKVETVHGDSFMLETFFFLVRVEFFSCGNGSVLSGGGAPPP